jgi:hypothetical protein
MAESGLKRLCVEVGGKLKKLAGGDLVQGHFDDWRVVVAAAKVEGQVQIGRDS